MCPYVDKETREELTMLSEPNTPGELTYVLQQAIAGYLRRTKLDYAHIAEVLGALEGCKSDFLERVVKPYEQTKLAANGDVWSEELLVGPKTFVAASETLLQPRTGAYADLPPVDGSGIGVE
jgi:hypothetical protein